MPAFTHLKLSEMFKAFDRVRCFSTEHPDFIARRVINAASAGAGTADELVEAIMRPINRKAANRRDDGAMPNRVATARLLSPSTEH